MDSGKICQPTLEFKAKETLSLGRHLWIPVRRYWTGGNSEHGHDSGGGLRAN